MSDPEFWSLVEESREAVQNSCIRTQEQSEFLQKILMRLDTKKILKFKISFEKMLLAANSWQLCAIHFLALNYPGDTAFSTFELG